MFTGSVSEKLKTHSLDQVGFNPHQIEVALFAFHNPFSLGGVGILSIGFFRGLRIDRYGK